jgi:hypothetical protein
MPLRSLFCPFGFKADAKGLGPPLPGSALSPTLGRKLHFPFHAIDQRSPFRQSFPQKRPETALQPFRPPRYPPAPKAFPNGPK